MVKEKKIVLCFSNCKSMRHDDRRVWPIWTPWDMIGRIYVNIQALGLVVLEKKILKCFSHYKPMADNDAPGVWPIWTPDHDWQEL